MPATNAPKAKDTPNSSDATKATLSATANTARRNSSRELIGSGYRPTRPAGLLAPSLLRRT